jgi:hypothetical protein
MLRAPRIHAPTFSATSHQATVQSTGPTLLDTSNPSLPPPTGFQQNNSLLDDLSYLTNVKRSKRKKDQVFQYCEITETKVRNFFLTLRRLAIQWIMRTLQGIQNQIPTLMEHQESICYHQ